MGGRFRWSAAVQAARRHNAQAAAEIVAEGERKMEERRVLAAAHLAHANAAIEQRSKPHGFGQRLTGRFWCEDSEDDEPEIALHHEDSLQAGSSPNAEEVHHTTATGSTRIKVRSSSSCAGDQRPGIQRRSKDLRPWKGPLPKPRESPRRTIADIIEMAIESGKDPSPAPKAEEKHQSDPHFSPISKSNTSFGGLVIPVGPPAPKQAHSSSGLAALWSRRWRPPQNPKQSSHSSTRDVLALTHGEMAGGGRGFAARRSGRPWSHNRGGRGQGADPTHGRGGGSGSRGTGGGRGRGDERPRGSGWAGRGVGTGRHSAPAADDVHHGAGAHHDVSKKRPMEKGESSDNANDKGDIGAKKKRVLCCHICDEEHLTPECPMLHAPKPSATFCGFAADGLGFFQIPYDKPAKPPARDVATAIIRIKEGTVPADLIKKELARLVPVKWPWMVQEHKEGFIVPFPNKIELQRLIAVKEVRTDHGEGVMLFQEWEQKIEPQQLLKKVWVNVYDVPYEIRSYLPLWALGTILGATQKVDMVYTKRTGVVRILVAVTDAKLIPNTTHIGVDDGLYEIAFKVDKILQGGVWEDNNNDDYSDDNEGGDEDEDGKDTDQGQHESFPEDATTDNTTNTQSIDDNTKSSDVHMGDAVQENNKEMAHNLVDDTNIRVMAEEILDSVVSKLLDEAANKVLAEDTVAIEDITDCNLENTNVAEIIGHEAAISEDITNCNMENDDITVVSAVDDATVLPATQTEAPHADIGGLEVLQEGAIMQEPAAYSGLGGKELATDNERKDAMPMVDCDDSLPVVVATQFLEEGEQTATGPRMVDIVEAMNREVQMEEEVNKNGTCVNTQYCFDDLTRQQLQFLSKLNGIRANMRNVAMRLALAELPTLVGWEEMEAMKNQPAGDIFTVPGYVPTPGRSPSNRLKASGDEDAMTKAKRIAAKRNLDEGNFQGYLLASLLEVATKGGPTGGYTQSMPNFGSGGNASIFKTWMAV